MKLVYKYQSELENTVSDALSQNPTYSSDFSNDHNSVSPRLVYNSCITKIPVLLEYFKGDLKLLF